MAADLVYSTPCILCPLILLLLLFYSFNNFSAKTSAPPSSLSNTSSEMISPNIPGAVKDDHFCNTKKAFDQTGAKRICTGRAGLKQWKKGWQEQEQR
ncbi:hypothetical protein OIU74_025280 [Salix koriyanagi]|uniref:Uncharacterized protein n=1 Tax=Salix koriyanagi TaxID=2511006 RepID=A0A9Q0W0V8_9ROSI|nr:hypothetical protein OIU74_025280 [Salix koriyanagi]